MTHELKTRPEYFQAVIDGVKPFEVRLDDRRFLVGDRLKLMEYEPNDDGHADPRRHGKYTGRIAIANITYKLTGVQFGVMPGYCVLGLGDITEV